MLNVKYDSNTDVVIEENTYWGWWLCTILKILHLLPENELTDTSENSYCDKMDENVPREMTEIPAS